MVLDKGLVDEVIIANRKFFSGREESTLHMFATQDSLERKIRQEHGRVRTNVIVELIADLTKASQRLGKSNEQIYKALNSFGYYLEVDLYENSWK